MKLRNGFVTNSSSSSFIIAKHKDCNIDTIYDVLKPVQKEIVEFFKESYQYLEDLPEELIAAIVNKDDKQIKKLGIDVLAKELCEPNFYETSIEINDWEIFAGECSNESDDPINAFIYEYSNLINDSDHFKIK